MSSKNTKVSITFDFLEWILTAGFTITTTRLLLGMIYMQDRQDLWRSDDRYVQIPAEAEMWAFCAELRTLVGPARANNAKSINKLIAEVDGTGLFDLIAMTDHNRRVRWRFSSTAHENMALRWLCGDFALLDIQDVAACRSTTTLDLYCRVRNLRKHPIPEFELPLQGRWCDHRRKFLSSLQQVVRMENTTAFVGLEWVRRGEGSQRLLVRLRHETTTWYPDKIRHWALNTRVFRVSPSEMVEIDGRNFEYYAIGDENPTHVEAILQKNLATPSIT